MLEVVLLLTSQRCMDSSHVIEVRSLVAYYKGLARSPHCLHLSRMGALLKGTIIMNVNGDSCTFPVRVLGEGYGAGLPIDNILTMTCF